jgi:probable F420-dependent oxidoreductase
MFWHATAFIDPTTYPALAIACEDAGFEGLLLSDHVMFPDTIESKYPYVADGKPFWTPETPWVDSWVAIGAMAAVTKRVRFSHNIFVFPLRHPVEVAKMAASASVMSHGRVALGAGAGWMAEEFGILGHDYHTRGKRMDEGIEICRALWAGSSVSYDGAYYQFPPITISPRPAAPIPILIGGHSTAALKRAARNDGWIGNAYPLPEADAKLDELDSYLRANGRKLGDPGYEVILGIYSLNPDDFKRYIDRGVTGFLAAPAMLAGYDAEAKGKSVTLEARLAAVQQFGEQVISKVAS